MVHSSSRRSTFFACVFLVLLPWSAKSVDISLLGTAGHITGLHGSDDSTATNVAMPKAPPQCWVQALKIFQPTSESEVQMSSKVCASMAPIHQQALAFELARCHLQDLGRKMIETVVGGHIDDLQDCVAVVYVESEINNDKEVVEQTSNFPNLPQCLKSMTDSGVHAYTLFFAQVVSLCNRLTHHMVVGFQQHTAMQLTKISHQTIELFTNTIQRQQDAFHEREAEMRKRHEDFYEALKKNQESLREDEASRMEAFKAWTTGLLSSWKSRDQEQKDQHDAWFRNLTQVWEDKSTAMEEQYLKKLASANSFIQPFLSIDAWITIAAQAYRLFVILLHGLLILLFFWFFTRPCWCRRVRGALFILVVMETIAELCVHFLINDLVSEDQKKAMVSSLRHTAVSVEMLVYAVGLVLSCCWCPTGGDGEDELYDGYDGIDGGEVNEDQNRRHRQEEMRNEFRNLMADAFSHRNDPLSYPAETASVPHARSTTPPVHSRVPPSPPCNQSATSNRSVMDARHGNTTTQVSRASTSVATKATGTTGIFRSKDTAASVHGVAHSCQANAAASNDGSLPTANGTGSEKTSVVRHLAFRNNKRQESVGSKAIAPVTGLVSGGVQNSSKATQSAHFSEWRKKRSSEEIRLSDDSDSNSETSVVDNGSSSPSPCKRRRVEVVEETTAVETTKEPSIPMDEDEYHTAAEEDDEQSTDEEDSTMADEDEGDDEPENRAEGKMDETK